MQASAGPIHLVLDSTGLELFGPGEWDAEKHGRVHRQWRKLHLAVDADTGEIAAQALTKGHADDAAQVPALLGQAEAMIGSVTADGAYDGEPTCAAAAARQRHPPPDVVPPRALAAPSSDKGGSDTVPNRSGCLINDWPSCHERHAVSDRSRFKLSRARRTWARMSRSASTPSRFRSASTISRCSPVEPARIGLPPLRMR